jgi:predicted MPP superfamily phosphohydrolase
VFPLAVCHPFVDNGIPWSPADAFNVQDYAQLTKQTGRDFHILQLSDVHLGDNADADEAAFSMIRAAAAAETPDLLVLAGDNIYSVEHNYAIAVRLTAFLDTLQIPYALVLGNHDGQGVFNDTQIGAVYARGKHSLFTRGPSNIPGCGNYAINLVNESGELLYALVLMDSNRYRGISEYDCIYPQQIAWYEWYLNGISDLRYGRVRSSAMVVPSLLFFHIPLPEINDLRNYLKVQNPVLEAYAFREPPTPSKVNTGMFQTIKRLQSTTHIFNGHDHLNVLDYPWEGVHFVYGLKTGPCSYHDSDRMGTTRITISGDLTVQVAFLFS